LSREFELKKRSPRGKGEKIGPQWSKKETGNCDEDKDPKGSKKTTGARKEALEHEVPKEGSSSNVKEKRLLKSPRKQKGGKREKQLGEKVKRFGE